MMPLDATQLKLDEVKRAVLFQAGTPLTDALTLLYHQWGQETPTLFDVMAVAYILNPGLCPVTPMHISVDDQGFTRAGSGNPNAQVCLDRIPTPSSGLYPAREWTVQHGTVTTVIVGLAGNLSERFRLRHTSSIEMTVFGLRLTDY